MAVVRASFADPAVAARYLASRLTLDPRVLVVTGSGLEAVANGLEEAVQVPFGEIPGLPSTDVSGHPGYYVHGRLGGRAVLVQVGRFHRYEGHPARTVAVPIEVAATLGVRVVVLTNAAGGIRADLEPGTIVALDGHLDLQGSRAAAPDPGARGLFRGWYDQDFIALAESAAAKRGIRFSRGRYAAVLGPAYETPAEVRALRLLGADLVGMSTVPEVLAARRLGLGVLALSLVVNRAAGLAEGELSHRDVLRAGGTGARDLGRLVRAVVSALPRSAFPTDEPRRSG